MQKKSWNHPLHSIRYLLRKETLPRTHGPNQQHGAFSKENEITFTAWTRIKKINVFCVDAHSMCSKTHTSNEKLIRTLCASNISIASRNLLSARALCCLIMQFNNLSRSQKAQGGGRVTRSHTHNGPGCAISGGRNPSVGTADETRSADQGDRPLPVMTTFSSESNNIHHTCWSMREREWMEDTAARAEETGLSSHSSRQSLLLQREAVLCERCNLIEIETSETDDD